MIEKIREEMYKKLEETASSHYDSYYFDLYGWAVLLQEHDRERFILEVSDDNWCSELTVTTYDSAKLSLLKAYILLLLHKHNDAAKAMLPSLKAFDILGVVSSDDFINIAMSKLNESDNFKKEVYSNINSQNASGPRNTYYDAALKIMIDTWSKYPLASKNGMKVKIIEYFGKDRFGKDKVSDSSVKRWIKINNLGPVKEVRPPIPFDLVTGS